MNKLSYFMVTGLQFRYTTCANCSSVTRVLKFDMFGKHIRLLVKFRQKNNFIFQSMSSCVAVLAAYSPFLSVKALKPAHLENLGPFIIKLAFCNLYLSFPSSTIPDPL